MEERMATSPSYYGNYSDKDQPTLSTVAKYIADARTLLQDKIPPYRYDDPSLLTALNVTMLEARRIRSDLFVYNFDVRGQAQAFSEVDDTPVNIEAPFRLAILHGLCGHALERDQEDVQDVRATTFLGLFNAGLVGRALAGVAGGSSPGPQQGGGPR
jgi:hypothetical protein